FSDAMVPVAAVGMSDKPVATITPAIAGTWRWIDTRVATFTAKSAYFANATEYVVTVPAGAKSITGNTLGEPVTQKFRTRSLTVTGVFPTGPLRPDSAVAVQLDQGFDAKAIQKFLRVVHAKRAVAYRVISLEEAEKLWAKNSTIRYDKAELPKRLGKHHLLIAPVAGWPAGVRPQIELAAKAPSTEGPLVADRASHTSFTVAPAFRVAGVECTGTWVPRMHGSACPMRSYMTVALTNSVDATSFRSTKIQLEGEEFEDHKPSGDRYSLMVPDGVGRTINVAIARDLIDVYGQPLVGPNRPSFRVARQEFAPMVRALSGLQILDPRWEVPQWVVTAEEVTALHVQLFVVKPADYLAYEAFERKERGTPPGKLVLDKFHPVGKRHGAILRTDLTPHLGANGTGHVIAVVHAQPTQPSKGWTPKTSAWLQVTRLATSARVDGEHVNAFVQDISPKRFTNPIAKANVSLFVEGRAETKAGATDADGHVELELLAPAKTWTNKQRGPTTLLQVTTNDDSMFTPFRGSHERAQRRHEARWYVTDDRFTYKPGEKVYLKGWVRWTHSGKNPDLALPAASDTIAYTLVDDRGNKMATGTVPVSDNGGFDLEVDLPANANQGTGTFTFMSKQSSVRHPISIQEFRRPAYAVNLDEDVTHSGATHVVLGEALEMQATAKYYAGGGLPGASVEWRAELQAATYVPPGWSAYTFDPQSKWDARLGEFEVTKPHAMSGNSSSTAIFGVTQVVAKKPSILTVDATVTDVDRMAIRASSRPILVHPSTLYVGTRLQPRTHDTVEVIVTDIDGNPVAGVPVDVKISARLWSERGRDDAKVMDTQQCKLTSQTEPQTCRVNRKDVEWVYSTVATVKDARERVSFTAMDLPWFSWERDAELVLVPDKKTYRPGDVAKLEIKSKELPAIANVTFARQGVIKQRRVELKTASTFVELPIEPGFLQNVHVLVDRWADRRWKHGPKTLTYPEIVSTELDLPVEVESARLNMKTRALKTLVEPGEQATFEVAITHEGKPKANAEVALIVVDEAILALSGKSHADPLAPFYREVRHGTTQFDSVDLVDDAGDDLSGVPGFERYSLDERGFGQGGGGGTGYGTIGSGRYGTMGHGAGSSIVVSRKDFRATAAFSPRLKTDASGKVRLTVTMPDSLTRFRIVALATADTRWFGKAESAIVTQRKVNARTVAPRFLSQGDKFSLPVVVQNLDQAPRTIDVAARAANLVAVGPAGRRVTLQGGQRAEVRFDFTTSGRGKAVVQTIAVSGAFADASNMDLPVYEPATTEAFATYGVVDDAAKFERLEVPGDVFPDVGGVEVELASTQLQSLTDAYWYLYAYPYECAEQRSSRMIATSAMFDILEAFASPGRPTKREIEAQVARDLEKLAKEQNKDGGWGYFSGMRSDPFVTAQVLGALASHRG
ncbi:MAG: hypothetical protein H0T65_27320, partial [Deltaproteobacteria bacterium]|nr:hypothetical protein [Deltaproteobacteria bacterium]